MNKLSAICCIALFASLAVQTSAQEGQALRLVQTIPLPGVAGRLDHMGVDLEQKRLFVAAVANNTLEVTVPETWRLTGPDIAYLSGRGLRRR